MITTNTFAGDLSLPFLMRTSSDDFSSPSLYPVDSDCLKRPAHSGYGFVLTEVNGVYFEYVNRCFWQAVDPYPPEAFNGYVIVSATWYPRTEIPSNIQTQGEECRNKPTLEGVQFSQTWKERDDNNELIAYYANYQGCLYYSPCASTGRCKSKPYISDFYPIAEADREHAESQIVKQQEGNNPPVDSGFHQSAPPPEMREGEYVTSAIAYEYYKTVFWEYCLYIREHIDSERLCFLSNNSDAPLQKLLQDAKPIGFRSEDVYDCYIKYLTFPELGNNVCFLKDGYYTDGRTASKCLMSDDNPRCRYMPDKNTGGNGGNGGNDGNGGNGGNGGGSGESPDLEGISSSLNAIEANTNTMNKKLNSIDSNTNATNKSVQASNTQLKKLNSTTEQILNTLKNNSGNTGSGGNYHGDIGKLNNDMNQNHEALMTALGASGEGEPDLSGLEGQYNASADGYGQSSLSAVDNFLSGLFDDIPDFNVMFELPPEFYGRSQRAVGSCIPYKKRLKIDLPYGYSYDFNIDLTTICDYYDGYFRGVATFILYFMTALACYRLYNRFMLSRF